MALPVLQKYHLYKVYRNGIFLGHLPKVKSEFGFNQDINTAGPNPITVVLGQSADVSGDAPDPLLDEDGDPFKDEDGNILYAERATEVVGNSNSRILARNGNKVRVYEYSRNYPNGKCVYNGKIKDWEGVWGEPGDITLSVFADGDELDNNPLIGSSYVSDQSQTTQDSIYEGFSFGKDIARAATVWQSFTVGAGVTSLAAIDIKIAAYDTDSIGKTVNVSVHASQADAESGDNPLTTAQIVLASTALAVKKVIFSGPIEVAENDVRYVRIRGIDDTYINIQLGYNSADDYAGGIARYSDATVGGGGGGGWTNLVSDIYFVTYSYGGETTAVFEDADPIDDIVATGMDNYVGSGGSIGYDSEDLVGAGLSLDYTFIGATVLGGINKAVALCPAGYYWTVDAGTNKLSVKPQSETADFTIIKGRHINSLKLKASIVDVKNDIPFAGGKVAGVNVYRRYTDTDSINEWGRGYDPQSDNRVTLTDTMDQLGQARLQIEKDEQYQTAVTLLDSKTDITQYKPGNTIGFAGFGPMIDSLVLIIVSIDYASDRVILSLGSLPPRTVITLEQINRDLEALQTVDNPDAPS